MSNDKTSNYLIAKSNISASQIRVLRRWIADSGFEQYESAEYLLPSSKKRPHNNLYQFMLPALDFRVVMKVTHIHKQYSWIRRLRALLKHYLHRDANYKAFRCCRQAYRNNLAAPMPLAYWQKRDSIVQVKSYFLYQYVENGMPWLEVANKLERVEGSEAQQYKDLLKMKIVDAIKGLHRVGIRHGDMVAHNILICVKDTHWGKAKICFIDYDRSTLARSTRPTFIKQFFDLRDLRKIYIDDASPYDLLNIYLGDSYHPLWRMVLTFWRLGKFKRYDKGT